jgi:hypothetical protein
MFGLLGFCLRSPATNDSVGTFFSPVFAHHSEFAHKEAIMRSAPHSSARLVLALSLLAGLLAATADAKVFNKTATGKPAIKSINVLGFAPEGVLLIGDGAGSQLFAIQTGDTKTSDTLAEKIPAINEKLAGRLGASPGGIEIIDLAVNPASGKAYIAVRKQDDKSYVILTVDGAGKIGELELDKVTYARTELVAGGKGKIELVTDVAWADDRVIAAGRSSEEFASKIFSIDAPLTHDAKSNVYSAETYHVQHGRWETKAPMTVVIPLKENGKTYVVGAFACTPIVKYPIDEIKPEATVKGTSVLELGSGNQPRDMFTYEKDGTSYVLANTFRFHHKRAPVGPSPYWTVKFEQGVLGEDQKVNEKALRRLGRDNKPATETVQVVDTFHGVVQMDKLDAKRALAIRQTEKGQDLEPLALP